MIKSYKFLLKLSIFSFQTLFIQITYCYTLIETEKKPHWLEIMAKTERFWDIHGKNAYKTKALDEKSMWIGTLLKRWFECATKFRQQLNSGTLFQEIWIRHHAANFWINLQFNTFSHLLPYTKTSKISSHLISCSSWGHEVIIVDFDLDLRGHSWRAGRVSNYESTLFICISTVQLIFFRGIHHFLERILI